MTEDTAAHKRGITSWVVGGVGIVVELEGLTRKSCNQPKVKNGLSGLSKNYRLLARREGRRREATL